ncbi:PREDICTED: protein indeterminate-domain 5, chloroplastic [Prunus mume]|uniref:Protein indeterminate-domain 5, chloroplastic n=1 Tax=Prunus mume TaxID=102107 RepID=A0ABM0N8A1_PRUMU|nr:PREDICTED: protein indeterminate-domain 5, chloroplastic [Prunus mume]XP_016648019.1 PREDICTED: protein indeterminate-domain 5, chloroplastic [Prunus mume]
MAASSSSVEPLFGIREEDQNQQMKQQHSSTPPTSSTAAAAAPPQKKKRNQPGTPNPEAEVIALSPKTLMATNRFICEVCNKGFQREQNLQLHRRGHNLPWKLKQKTTKEPKRKVYLCPEPTCVHHDPSRALGDLTGIKKHFSRKHGEKKWKCEKCSKRYAVQSDWKAHSKTCGTREYRCDCGTLFSRRDSFITHRAFCDALAQESARHPPSLSTIGSSLYGGSLSNTGLGLSHQVVGPPQISSLQQDHSQSSTAADILRLGGAGAAGAARTGQFDHLLGSSFRPAAQSSASFFLTAADQSTQQQYHDHDQDKSFQGLMQFSDNHHHHHHHLHQNNNNSNNPPHHHSAGANLFSLPFLSNNTTNTTNNNNSATNNNLLISPDHFNTNVNGTTTAAGGSEGSHNLFSGHIVGGDHISTGIPSLYSTNSNINNNNQQQQQQHASMAHMSATALLQKAAQMGSTNSSNNTTASLLRSFGSSSSATAKSDRPGALVPSSLGGMFGSDQHDQSHLQDLMNSFANTGGSSIFANASFGGYDAAAANRAINMEETKLQQQNSLGVSNIGGADRLTRDFLGVGQVVRSMSGGFSHQRSEHHSEQQHGMDMSSLDSESNAAAAAAPSSQSFGGGGNFQ